MYEFTPEQRALIAEFEENARRAVERIENSWWRELLKAEYERTGDYGPVAAFVRRFKADEARRFKAAEARRYSR